MKTYDAEPEKVTNSSKKNITQVHIAYGRDPSSEVSISWMSNASAPQPVGFGLVSDFHGVPPYKVNQFSLFAPASDAFM
jgi:hypothetical protein